MVESNIRPADRWNDSGFNREIHLPQKRAENAPDRLDAAVLRQSEIGDLGIAQQTPIGLQQTFGEAGPLRGMAVRGNRMMDLVRTISDPWQTERSTSWLRMDATFEYTRSGGFHTLVMPLEVPGLAVLRGHPDLHLESGERYMDVIRPDAFVHSDPAAQVLLKLDTFDDEVLPEWIQFNSRTGELIIEPPVDAPDKLILRVTAADDQGNKKSFVIRLHLSGEVIRIESARSLAERLREAR